MQQLEQQQAHQQQLGAGHRLCTAETATESSDERQQTNDDNPPTAGEERSRAAAAKPADDDPQQRRSSSRRVHTSLPNCALRHHLVDTSEEAVEEQNRQRSRDKKSANATAKQPAAKPKSRGPNEQRNAHNHHQMAFLGTVKDTVEFLRGTIGRSRRKGADLAGARDGAQARPGPCGNNGGGAGNGVCPMPDTQVNGAGGTTVAGSSQKKSAAGPAAAVAFAQAGGSAKTGRKQALQSVDTCVADSFDDPMVDKMCALPAGLERNEWLATHVLALFEHVNGLSGTLSEVCTPVTCTVMSFPGNMKAAWLDERGKRHNYAAMRYIDSVMSVCEAARKNQAYFPTKYGATFCADFEQQCARIVRLLWHCMGHMYSKHWEHMGALNLRPQFGLVLAHLARLAKQYALMADKELVPVQNTLQLVRPAVTAASTQVQRPVKRSLDSSSSNGAVDGDAEKFRPNAELVSTTTTAPMTTSTGASSSTVQGRIQKQKKEQLQQAKAVGGGGAMLAMKSGSWGGHSALAVAQQHQANVATTAHCSGLLANCQKCCYAAQTC